MTNTTKVSWTKNGKKIEVEITLTRDAGRKSIDLDGHKVQGDTTTTDSLTITVYADGKRVTNTYNKPTIVTREFNFKTYDAVTAAGGYAQLGDAYISKEHYNLIMAAIEDLEATTTTPEYAEVKAQEEKKEAAEMEAEQKENAKYNNLIKSGFCPKCGSWCYGDCKVNK